MRRILIVILKASLGGIFLVAGALKLLDPSKFANEIANYQLLPGAAPYLAAALPVVEIVLALALIVARPLWSRAAALGLAVVLATFTVATAAALARGINVDCGCFGRAGGPITRMTVVRDVILVIVAIRLALPRNETAVVPAPPLG